MIDDAESAVSWRAILAGSTAAVALSLALAAFGVGVGLSVVSPWADSGISSTTFTISAGIYLIAVAMIASTIGGYLAGRLRPHWNTVHEHERYFRDSAHGFVVWAFATVVSAAVLGGAFTHILAGASAGLAPAASSAAQASPNDAYVDALLRTDPGQSGQAAAVQSGQLTSPTAQSQNAAPLGQTASGNNANAGRGEITRILVPTMRKGGNVSDADRSYLVRLVSARTGLSQADANQRVNQVITQATAAADAARKSLAQFSLWLVASMLAGALAASLAAIEGGNLRNREWYLTPADRTRSRNFGVPAE